MVRHNKRLEAFGYRQEIRQIVFNVVVEVLFLIGQRSRRDDTRNSLNKENLGVANKVAAGGNIIRRQAPSAEGRGGSSNQVSLRALLGEPPYGTV